MAVAQFAQSKSMLCLSIILLTTQLGGCEQHPDPDYQIKAVILPDDTDTEDADNSEISKKSRPTE